MRLAVLAATAIMVAVPALSAPAARADRATRLGADTIIRRAIAAAGGEAWTDARTLKLSGHAIFYGDAGPIAKSRADKYRMWRVFDPDRETAHIAEGKVRILAQSGDRTIFTIGYDGSTTWNKDGVVPKKKADAFWESNFGFGIIRHAKDAGFEANRMPDDVVEGHPVYMVRLTDPSGGQTLFGFDQKSYAIRYMGFATPRGWHERIYDHFVTLSNPRWLQAKHVTLKYDGVKANEVFWETTRVNEPIDPSIFAPPSGPDHRNGH